MAGRHKDRKRRPLARLIKPMKRRSVDLASSSEEVCLILATSLTTSGILQVLKKTKGPLSSVT